MEDKEYYVVVSLDPVNYEDGVPVFEWRITTKNFKTMYTGTASTYNDAFKEADRYYGTLAGYYY